jgi:pyruvate formate lyase activating enzyme
MVLDIQRLSTEDGPGLRTTVFMKGCSLSCEWCHNPESIRFPAQVQWVEGGRCIGCGLCIAACPNGGLSRGPDGIEMDRDICDACGSCVAACPTGAMEQKGTPYDLGTLVNELLKDTAFFGKDGGITFSGGEALMQPEFVLAALRALKDEGVHTAVDTAGLVRWEHLQTALDTADLVLYDLKLMDSEEHRRLTGAPNELILQNARKLAAYVREHGRPEIWVRTPIIPGATDTENNIRAIAGFIASELEDVTARWELCAFNNLCISKYERLGLEWQYAKSQKIERARLDALLAAARALLPHPEKAAWTGSAKLEK